MKVKMTSVTYRGSAQGTNRPPIVLLLTFLAATSAHAQDSDKCNAAGVWDSMISAKGGRVRLEAVQSFFVAGTYTWNEFLVRRRRDVRTLYRFPDFVWCWFDTGTPMFGIVVSSTYVDRGYRLSIWGPGVHAKLKREVVTPETSPTLDIPVLLLETRWTKPTLTNCSIDGWTTTLEVRFEGMPYSYVYYLQGESKLPHRVDMKKAKGITTYRLSDYKPYDGLMLPRAFRRQYETLPPTILDQTYEINPNYDLTLPDREPSLAAGPDGWQKKRKN